MNRKQRREFDKGGKSSLTSPCSITEAVQIANAAAEDAIARNNIRTNPLRTSMILQLEVLKEVLFKSDLISEDEFKGKYAEKVADYNKAQEEMRAKAEAKRENPNMEPKASEIEVTKE